MSGLRAVRNRFEGNNESYQISFVAALVGAALCMGAAIAASGQTRYRKLSWVGRVATKAADSLKKDAVCALPTKARNWPVLSSIGRSTACVVTLVTPNCQVVTAKAKASQGNPRQGGLLGYRVQKNFTTSSAEDQSGLV